MRRDWFRAFAVETGRVMGAVSAMAAVSPSPVAHVAYLSPTVAATANGSQVLDKQCVQPFVARVASVAQDFEVGCACADAVPMEWTDGLAHLSAMAVPHDFLPTRWGVIVSDAAVFIDRWSSSATALGWTTLDLFGVGKDAPFHRLDLVGLVPLIGGKVVVALTEATARLKCRDGTIQTFHRKPDQPGRVPLWEL